MDIFDNAIIRSSNAICLNIDNADLVSAEVLALNVLSQSRNLVEAIIRKEYSLEHKTDLGHQSLQQALKFVKAKDKYAFLTRFHKKLEVTDSHLTVEPDAALRLMWRYYDYLLKCRSFAKKSYDLDILNNLEKFPQQEDSTFHEYYNKIAFEVNRCPIVKINESPTNRFRILRKKLFSINGERFCELTLIEADNKASKFDRIIAFTKLDIPTYYSVHLNIIDSSICIINRRMPIKIVVGFMVSVRPCEFDNYFRFIGHITKVRTKDAEYMSLMRYLSVSGRNLTELLDCDDEVFERIRDKICLGIKSTDIFDGLSKCRKLLGRPGYNLLVYLLYRLNNVVLRDQFFTSQNEHLSYLYFHYKSIPFDVMPFANSLHNHNTDLADLFDCISIIGREHELLGRVIRNNTEINAKLYTPIKELDRFKELDRLIQLYNSKLYYKHVEKSSLVKENGFVYIAGYEKDSILIVRRLMQLARHGLKGYEESVGNWLETTHCEIDDDVKKEILKKLFVDSSVALIYGSAGTGKSTLVGHISEHFRDSQKIYLANTHAAVENLRRRIGKSGNNHFYTIKWFLEKCPNKMSDILFIDECSTVSNADMVKILDCASFKLLVLVGDMYQIESIKYGNWFNIAKNVLNTKSIHELDYVYRSADNGLLMLWDAVRNLDERMYDIIELNHFSTDNYESIFEKKDLDEIILCLNYDGLYGINNLNKFIQGDNKEKSVLLGMDEYKIGDRVIFKETERFGGLLYNNLKGIIVGIEDKGKSIHFSIQVETGFNELEVGELFDLEPSLETGKSVVGFDVQRFKNSDDDDKTDSHIVPFQVAYAVSIHKAQGLEYKSVKIIITDSVEEMISHNIFYTAITRAKNYLRIYWSKNTEGAVLDSMHFIANKEDAAILMKKIKMKQN